MSGASRPRGAIVRTLNTLLGAFLAGVSRLDKSLSPAVTLRRLQQHHFTLWDSVYLLHLLLASFWLIIMQSPGFPLKLLIPLLFALALLVPLTSQFFLPAIPIFAYLLTFYSSRFIPEPWRPKIFVSLLPTLESVLYGANISDILTRVTHPVLDIIAWFPYGVGHYAIPFFVAAFLWLFRSKQSLHLWARAFGYLNLTGVVIQILLPCSAPWYELIYGLTPANYSMKGSPGGLARIDALFHSHGYTTAFSHSPVVFGAFPSLHAGCATMEALFLSHFFPQTTRYVWTYVGVLYWATMYLTHHYLIDVVGGACLATAFFYLFLPDLLKGPGALAPPGGLGNAPYTRLQRNKYEVYDLEVPAPHGLSASDFDVEETSSDDEEMDITYRAPAAAGSNSNSGVGAVPAKAQRKQDPRTEQAKKSHRHTASIASLIRGDERGPEDGWSPVKGAFMFPPNGGNSNGRESRSRD